MTDPDFDRAVLSHDRAVAALGLEIWCGTEPTFTDRFSEAPEWYSAALGGDKAKRAERLARLIQRRAGGMVLRALGRQYPGEELPRWSFGIYARRDGSSPWQGPPDPMLIPSEQPPPSDQAPPPLPALQAAVVKSLAQRGLTAEGFASPDQTLRVRFWPQGTTPAVGADDPRLHRPSVHSRPISPEGLRDELAETGLGLLIVAGRVTNGEVVACIELPGFDTTERFARVLEAIGEAAGAVVGLPSLILAGYPPPVDARIRWSTITPDPAVIEVNMAPYPALADLLEAKRNLYAAAAEVGLAPFRLYYNGTVADSGGGGQITLGGPSPEDSPFLRQPQLLTGLIRYCNHHPALSYLFAHDSVGGSGQAVRADERGRDALHELCLALALLEHDSALTPERLWAGLAPFMTDNCGNSHRAEINLEKLWNPRLPGRGMQGLVEFRGLRMQHSPERAVALTALLRAVIARLATHGFNEPLRDWGDELHERFALSFYLRQDLETVLADLSAADLPLDAPLASNLLCGEEYRDWADLGHADCLISIRRALEFWPLVGDAGTQEAGDSRLVDSSTTRLELCLRPVGSAPIEVFSDWRLAVNGLLLPLRLDRDTRGPARVFALRYRSFLPSLGLHPALGPQGPLRLTLFHPQRSEALAITLHEWRPDNAPYPGLPADLTVARERRSERCITARVAAPDPASLRPPAREALTAYSLDLRWPA